jgi:tetratricopeptide (TPR) repeat protein
MESCQRLSGDDHPLTVSFTVGLATARRGLGRPEEAVVLCRQAAEALAGRPKLYFPLVRTELQYCYGVCLTELGQYDEAEAELLAAYEGEARIRGEDHEKTRRCIESLIALYDAWGQPDKAAEYRALLTPEEIIASAAELAEALIRDLGAAETIIDRLESDSSLPEAVRVRALRHIHNRLQDAETAAAVHWWFLRSSDCDAAMYRAALDQARDACRLEPENRAYLRNLGAALYRVGAYADALPTLRRAEQVHRAQTASSHPADVAFIAMACQQLGENELARAELDRARALLKRAEYAESEELRALLAEAEALIAGNGSDRNQKNGS